MSYLVTKHSSIRQTASVIVVPLVRTMPFDLRHTPLAIDISTLHNAQNAHIETLILEGPFRLILRVTMVRPRLLGQKT